MKTHFILLLLSALFWVSCDSMPAEPKDFRAQFAGMYELHHVRTNGDANGDTTLSRDEIITLDVHFEVDDCILTNGGYDCDPSMSFGDDFEVVVQEDGRFSFILGYVGTGPVEGGFIGTDSVYVKMHYQHSASEFQQDILSGRKL